MASGLACPTETGRLSAETMPLVTVASRPNGEPIATTSSPTSIVSEVLSVAGDRPDTSCALITARSVRGSVPRISASALDPSSKLTDTDPPAAATSTTWLLVRISPSALKMMPDPEPCPCSPWTLIFTTEGSTELATSSTEPGSGAESVLTTGASVAVGVDVVDVPSVSESAAAKPAAPTRPLIPPTTTAAVRIPAVKTPLGLDERGRSCSGGPPANPIGPDPLNGPYRCVGESVSAAGKVAVSSSRAGNWSVFGVG